MPSSSILHIRQSASLWNLILKSPFGFYIETSKDEYFKILQNKICETLHEINSRTYFDGIQFNDVDIKNLIFENN